MHTIGFLRDGLDAVAVTQAAARRGITVAPISRFGLEPVERDGLVLGFSGFTPVQIQAGVLGLRQAIDDLAST
jgi:GntR family transcriptional regulator/MocR family aminotransferase